MPEDILKTPGAWDLDRKIPLALIIAVLAQFVLGIWYLAKSDSRIDHIDQQVLTLQQNYQALNNARESALIAATKLGDNMEQNNNMLRALLNRSNVLHPELPHLKEPTE